MPLDLSRIRGICFDVDGTLSDTDDQFVQRLARALRPVRFLFHNGDTRRAARRFVMWSEAPANWLIGIPDTLRMDDKIAAIMEWFNRHRSRPRQDFLLIPGVKEMLQTLHARYPLAIVSARDAASTRAFLDQFGLTGYFQTIVTALTVEHTKPYPDPILHAARVLNVPPESILMVGDTYVDIRAGEKAGAQTVGVLCGFGEKPELRRFGADLILPTTADLVRTLEA